MAKKPGKLHQKAIDIAKSQVIEAGNHKYCPTVYRHIGNPSCLYVAMDFDADGTAPYGIFEVSKTGSVASKIGKGKEHRSLMAADQELARIARKSDGLIKKIHDGFDLYDERRADEGKPPQKKNATMAVVKAAPDQKGHGVSFLDEQFLADYSEEVAQFGVKSKEFAELTLRIGLRLEFVKSQLKHGQLNKWIEEHGGISVRHARRCRKLAQVFIKAQQIGDDEMFALVDPENSKEALIKKLEQLAFDFIGDDSQAELFAKYGIQVREPVPIKHAPEPKLKPGETLLARDADQRIGELQKMMFERCVEESTSELPYLDPRKLKMFLDTVILTKNAVEDQIKAG